MKLSRSIIIWSVVLYFALSIPVSALHEMGHAYVCAATGFEYQIWVDATGGHTLCSGGVRGNFVYNAMGGVFGLAGSAAVITIWVLAKRHYAILAVGLAYFVDQSAKIILEGYFMRIYESGAIDAYITALQVISWLGFMLYFARTKEPARVAASDT